MKIYFVLFYENILYYHLLQFFLISRDGKKNILISIKSKICHEVILKKGNIQQNLFLT